MSYSYGNLINDLKYFTTTSESSSSVAFENLKKWLSTIENIPGAEDEIYLAVAELLQNSFRNMADIAETIPQLPENISASVCAFYWRSVATYFRQNANMLPREFSPEDAKDWLYSVCSSADTNFKVALLQTPYLADGSSSVVKLGSDNLVFAASGGAETKYAALSSGSKASIAGSIGAALPGLIGAIASGMSIKDVAQGIINGDSEALFTAVVGIWAGIMVAWMAPMFGAGALLTLGLVIGAEIFGRWAAGYLVAAIKSPYDSSQQFLRTVFADPLVLDMDGDGIETLSVNSGNPVYFDFNSDGTKTNTGWISPDDAYLVFDRNDNGVIDDASELFSDYTPLYAGGRAANGFAALAQEDTNADGVVNHLDANWNHLKIWQDINSDGITQENELRTMEEAGIIGINTARADTSQTFANGNAIRGTGTYMKADGTIGDMGDAYYAVDTVNQQFTNPIPISPEVEALPNVQGMGLVRDLRQAAELSPVLQYLLTQYSQASTRQEQMAIIDQLLYAWADTSGMAATMESVKDEYLQEAA